jgi:hypothetical protein
MFIPLRGAVSSRRNKRCPNIPSSFSLNQKHNQPRAETLTLGNPAVSLHKLLIPAASRSCERRHAPICAGSFKIVSFVLAFPWVHGGPFGFAALPYVCLTHGRKPVFPAHLGTATTIPPPPTHTYPHKVRSLNGRGWIRAIILFRSPQ